MSLLFRDDLASADRIARTRLAFVEHFHDNLRLETRHRDLTGTGGLNISRTAIRSGDIPATRLSRDRADDVASVTALAIHDDESVIAVLQRFLGGEQHGAPFWLKFCVFHLRACCRNPSS